MSTAMLEEGCGVGKSAIGRWLLVIVVLAVAVRIGVGLVHPFSFPDSKDYDARARTIVEHRTYEVGGQYASRMPGYPVFVAAIYCVCGYSIKAVLVGQGLLAGITVWLTFLVGRRVSGCVGLLAAAVVAVDPLSVAFSASLLTEEPFTLLLVLAIYIGVRLLERASLGLWVVMGVVWVVAVEFRPAVLWCAVPLAVVLVIAAGGWRDRVVHVAGLILTLLFVYVSLIPWQQRCDAIISQGDNLTQNERPTRVHFTTLEGISLYEAVYPEATGGPKQDVIALPDEMKLLNEAQRNDEWSRRAWGCIWSDPGRIAGLAIKKIGRTWSPVLNAAEFQNGGMQVVLAMWHIPLFILAIFGLFGGRMPFKMKMVLLVPVLYFTAVHSLFLGSVRYRVPLAPMVAVFAAAGIIALVERVKSCKQSRSATV